MNSIVIWGAGKIGRGFIADLFSAAGYSLFFVDESLELISKLRNAGQYDILKLFSQDEHEKTTNRAFEAYHTSETEKITDILKYCNLLALTIFPAVFEKAASDIAKLIEARVCEKTPRPLDILICANISHPAPRFEELLLAKLSDTATIFFKEHMGLVETIVIRMAVEANEEQKRNDPLVVVTNGYPELILDKMAFKGIRPDINGLHYTDNIRADEVKKMFTYNMVHAIYAYLGYHQKYEYIFDAACDPAIEKIACGALEEISKALHEEFHFSMEELSLWNKSVLKNVKNPILKDRVDRVGADPLRKLAREDRLTGAALLCRKHGILPYYLSKAMAYAFLFKNSNDYKALEVQQYIESQGIRTAVRDLCGLQREPELVQLVLDQYKKATGTQPEDNEEKHIFLLRKAYEQGFKMERKYRGCAQCLLAAMAEVTGKLDKNLFQAASGLSGGMGLCIDGSCGGYSGGILFMGTYAGRRYDLLENGDKEAQYKSYEMAQKLHDRFVNTYGSVQCSDIHREIFGVPYNLKTKPIRDQFEEAGAHRDKCTSVIANAAMWVADILWEEQFEKDSILSRSSLTDSCHSSKGNTGKGVN